MRLRIGRSPWRLAVPALAGGCILVLILWNSEWIDEQVGVLRVGRLIAAENLADARDLLIFQVHRNPSRPWPRFLLAQVERRSGRIIESEEILQRAVELGLPIAVAFREHALLTARGDFPTAEPLLLNLLSGDARDTEVHRALAEGYLQAARWDEALSACSAWFSADPGDEDARLGRAIALRSIGRADPAILDCRAILARAPDHFEARLELAEALLEANRVDEARAEADRCHARAPDRPEPLVTLAASSSAQADPDGAVEILRRALERSPSFVPALRAMAAAQRARGRDDLARPYSDRAALLDLARPIP